MTPLTLLEGTRNIYLKDETLQISGAFKYRGAFAQLSNLPSFRKIVTASTGNHGIAVAQVGSRLGHSVHVFVPQGTPSFKLALLGNSGATVTVVGEYLDQSTAAAKEWAHSSGAQWVSGFDDPEVVDGYRPMLREIGDAMNAQHRIFVPVGGGGLFAAALLECKFSEVIAVQSEAATSLEESMNRQYQKRANPSSTIATGLAVPLIGRIGYHICAKVRPRLLKVSDADMISAMRLLWNSNGIRAEAAGVAALAGALLFGNDDQVRNVCIVSGGNVEPAVHATLIA